MQGQLPALEDADENNEAGQFGAAQYAASDAVEASYSYQRVSPSSAEAPVGTTGAAPARDAPTRTSTAEIHGIHRVLPQVRTTLCCGGLASDATSWRLRTRAFLWLGDARPTPACARTGIHVRITRPGMAPYRTSAPSSTMASSCLE